MINYFFEIKNRLFLLLITYSSTVLILYCYKEILLFLLIFPCHSYKYKKYETFYFIFTDVTEVFSVYINLIIFMSFQILLIFFSYHTFVFVNSALFKYEYKYFKLIFKSIVTVWLISFCFSHCLIIPLTQFFFLSFQPLIIEKSFDLYFEAKLSEYIYFYINSYYACLFYFQFFATMFFVFNYVIVKIRNIKKFRKAYYVSLIFFSTIISPDFLTQTLLSIILIIGYEIWWLIFIFNYLKQNIKRVTN